MNYEGRYIETPKKEEKESNLEVGGNPDSVELYLSLASKRKKKRLGSRNNRHTHTHARTYTSLILPPLLSNHNKRAHTHTHNQSWISPTWTHSGPTQSYSKLKINATIFTDKNLVITTFFNFIFHHGEDTENKGSWRVRCDRPFNIYKNKYQVDWHWYKSFFFCTRLTPPFFY